MDSWAYRGDNEAADCDCGAREPRVDRQERRAAQAAIPELQPFCDKRRLLDTSIKELELSVRSHNCLWKERILTIGDLIRRTEDEIAGIRSLGRISLDEIKRQLREHGLYLGSVAGTTEAEDGEKRLLDASVDELALSVRPRNCLRHENIRTIGDLIHRTESEIAEIRNLGRRSLEEITKRLEDLGLKLSEEADDREALRGLICLENAAVFKDELVHAIRRMLSSNRRRLACFLAYHGVEGERKVTLQAIADNAAAYGFVRTVTRERVRQVIANAERRIRLESSRVKFVQWEASVAAAGADLPKSVDTFLTLFGYGESESPDHTFRMIEFFSDVFGLDFPFEIRSVTGVGALVFDRASEGIFDALGGLPSAAGGAYSSSTEVARKLCIGEQTLARAIDGSVRWEFLDENRQYFWSPPSLPPTDFGRTGNAVLTGLCKVFSVTARVRTTDLALSVARDRVFRKRVTTTRAIPLSVLEGIAERSGLFEVRNDEIVRRDGLEWCAIGTRDAALLAICVECGRVVTSSVLYSKLRSRGISRENANQVITYSPFLVHTVSGAWEQKGVYKFVPKPDSIDLRGFAVRNGRDSRK